MLGIGILAAVVICAVIFAVAMTTSNSSSVPTNGETTTTYPTQTYTGTVARITVQNEDGEAIAGAHIYAVTGDGTVEGLLGVCNDEGQWEGRTPDGASEFSVKITERALGSEGGVGYAPLMTSFPSNATQHTAVLLGYSSLSPWMAVKNAVGTLPYRAATARITYSYIPDGVIVHDAHTDLSMTIMDHVDGSVTAEAFHQEIEAAFAEWKQLLESVFSPANGYGHPLTVQFARVEEQPPYPPLFGVYDTRDGQVGDFRIGMWDMEGDQQVLAYAYGPNNAPYAVAGDMLFNATVDWRKDSDVWDGGDGGYSIKYVAAHEIGHALGFGHHVLDNSLMAPTAGRHLQFSAKFVDGLAASVYERNAARAIFG